MGKKKEKIYQFVGEGVGAVGLPHAIGLVEAEEMRSRYEAKKADGVGEEALKWEQWAILQACLERGTFELINAEEVSVEEEAPVDGEVEKETNDV